MAGNFKKVFNLSKLWQHPGSQKPERVPMEEKIPATPLMSGIPFLIHPIFLIWIWQNLFPAFNLNRCKT